MKHAFAAVAVIVAANAFGQLVACASLQEALFGPSTPLINPVDDAELFHCRMIAEVDHDFSHDAGGACRLYDSCVIDAGLRGDIGFCGDAGKP